MSTFSTCTSATRPSSPTDGDVLFETDTNNVIIWDGTNWRGYANDGISFPPIANSLGLSLDGIDDHLDCGNDSALNLTGGFTINCYARQNDTGNNTIVQRRTGGNGYQVYLNSGSFVYYGGTTRTFGSGYTSTSDFYMLTVTHTGGTNGTVKGYVNGSLLNTFTDTYTSIASQNFYIGKHYLGTAYSHHGFVDEVGVWSSVLTASEIESIYNAGNPIDLLSNVGNYTSSADLVGYWRMGDGSGDTDSGGGTPADGDTVGTVKNLANPGTHDGTGSGGALYSSTTP